MSGMVYAFMTGTSVDLDGNEDEREELNGWIDQDWSMTVLHDSRNDVMPLVKEWESDTEELADSVRDVLGDGSLWEDNGDGSFYAKDERQAMHGVGGARQRAGTRSSLQARS